MLSSALLCSPLLSSALLSTPSLWRRSAGHVDKEEFVKVATKELSVDGSAQPELEQIYTDLAAQLAPEGAPGIEIKPALQALMVAAKTKVAKDASLVESHASLTATALEQQAAIKAAAAALARGDDSTAEAPAAAEDAAEPAAAAPAAFAALSAADAAPPAAVMAAVETDPLLAKLAVLDGTAPNPNAS